MSFKKKDQEAIAKLVMEMYGSTSNNANYIKDVSQYAVSDNTLTAARGYQSRAFRLTPTEHFNQNRPVYTVLLSTKGIDNTYKDSGRMQQGSAGNPDDISGSEIPIGNFSLTGQGFTFTLDQNAKISYDLRDDLADDTGVYPGSVKQAFALFVKENGGRLNSFNEGTWPSDSGDDNFFDDAIYNKIRDIVYKMQGKSFEDVKQQISDQLDIRLDNMLGSNRLKTVIKLYDSVNGTRNGQALGM